MTAMRSRTHPTSASSLLHLRVLDYGHGQGNFNAQGSAIVVPLGDERLIGACRNLVACELRTDAYLSSPAPAVPGRPARLGTVTMHDHLVSLLVLEFAPRYELEGLSDDDLVAAAKLDRDERAQGNDLYQAIMRRAWERSILQLWDDLQDAHSSRHQTATDEVRFHAREHLERSRFMRSKRPAFAFLRTCYEELWKAGWKHTGQVEPGSGGDLRTWAGNYLFEAFWTLGIPPLDTSPLQSEPLKFHLYLQQWANRFMTEEFGMMKELAGEAFTTTTDSDDDVAPDPVDNIPSFDPSPALNQAEREDLLRTMLDRANNDVRSLPREDVKTFKEKKGAFLRTVARELLTEVPDVIMARILDSMARRFQGQGYDLLVYLLTAIPEYASSGGGKNTQARRSLNAWMHDPQRLESYLRSLDISEDQVQTTLDLTVVGLMTAPELSDSQFSRNKTAFRDALWEDLIASTLGDARGLPYDQMPPCGEERR